MNYDPVTTLAQHGGTWKHFSGMAIRYGDSIIKKDPYFIMSLCYSEIGAGRSCTGGTIHSRNDGIFRTGIIILRQCRFPVFSE